jgi:hypothetical protein
MFDRFIANFSLLPTGQRAGDPWREPRLASTPGYLDLATTCAGCSFENGLYRVHDMTTGPRGLALIAEVFPEFAARACPFGYDWLGRQFALDSIRTQERVDGAGDQLVLLLEPGTGQVLEVALGFEAFHEQLADLREPALAAGFFGEWADANPALIPLKHTECVGYRVPLFLGGADTIENLEVIDLDVYWSLCGQLRQGTRRLPPGSSIRQVSITSP